MRVDDAEADARFVRKPSQLGAVGAFLGAGRDRRACLELDRWRVLARARALDPLRCRDREPALENARLSRIAITDELTLSLDRRALETLIPREPTPGDAVLSVALFDADHFKAINDRLGHAAGDDVLRAVRTLLASPRRCRRRLGGGEFLLVLTAARQLAELGVISHDVVPS